LPRWCIRSLRRVRPFPRGVTNCSALWGT
jgi:hypothetical protein